MDIQQAKFWRQLHRIRERKGYTLLEMVIVLALLALMMGVVFPDFFVQRDRILLGTTARELESACRLARQLSMDESREYVVELSSSRFSVRENWTGSQRVISSDYPAGIMRGTGSHDQAVFGREGLTGYSKLVLENRRKQYIEVEVHIGTGRITVSEIKQR